MTFKEALVKTFQFNKATSTVGRAKRSEFWYTTAICVVMSAIIDALSYVLTEKIWGNEDIDFIFTLLSAYFLIVNISCMCRRMHDIRKSNTLPVCILVFAGVAFLAPLLSKFTSPEIASYTEIILNTISAILLVYTLYLCTKDSK